VCPHSFLQPGSIALAQNLRSLNLGNNSISKKIPKALCTLNLTCL